MILSTSRPRQQIRCTFAVFAITTLIILNNGVLQTHGFGLHTSSLSRTPLIPINQQIIKPPSFQYKSINSLSMHMGHSHSHNHHSQYEPAQQTKRPLPKGWRGKLLLLSGRRPLRILFAALITLLPPIIKKKSLLSITKTHIGAFVLTSGTLAILDNIGDEFKAIISRGESWRMSMLKHSTPLSAAYFFRNENAADRVTFLGAIVNILLSAGKFIVGVGCHSSALIADAGHSLSDLFSDFVTLWAVQVARLPPDDDHPYGHGKFESVGSLFLSLTLLGTGLSVGVSSYMKFLRIINMQRTAGLAAAAQLVDVPRWPALVMAAMSIVSKEWLYRITRRVGEELNSQVVIANAWHHRSDAYSSVLALVSIGLAMSVPGFLAADPFAGMLVAGMIAMTGAEIMGESVKQLTDAVTDEELVKNVKIVSSEDADVRNVTRVRARQVGSRALVDVDVDVPLELSASAHRAIEERIRVRIMSDVDGVMDVTVKATEEAVVFCPLLTAIEDSDEMHHISATEVEEEARALLDANSNVKSVRGVTVHYQDTVLVRVDANICVDPDITVSQANILAATLRRNLESSDDIDQANIFLDLNAVQEPALSP